MWESYYINLPHSFFKRSVSLPSSSPPLWWEKIDCHFVSLEYYEYDRICLVSIWPIFECRLGNICCIHWTFMLLKYPELNNFYAFSQNIWDRPGYGNKLHLAAKTLIERIWGVFSSILTRAGSALEDPSYGQITNPKKGLKNIKIHFHRKRKYQQWIKNNLQHIYVKEKKITQLRTEIIFQH